MESNYDYKYPTKKMESNKSATQEDSANVNNNLKMGPNLNYGGTSDSVFQR